MKMIFKCSFTIAMAFGFILNSALCSAQETQEQEEAKPTEEHKLLKSEVGDWKVKGKIFMGENTEEFEAKETVKAIGEFWTISDYRAKMFGTDFNGSGTMGYNPDQKKFVGTWVDSTHPHASHMLGTYDKESKTLTYKTIQSRDGKETVGKITVVYTDEDTRKFTMYDNDPNDKKKWTKSMEMEYTRVKKE